ncbi:MAG TPA: ferritin-like domain-containing protein [Bacteroidales bacterium]|jgi:bacterioferritin|nr:ferritin-like domain-containing protein [Bacteroidales bacterium]HRC78300.1 ferritin-like domain-containing protein [Bacteroidales bacterium]
MGTRGKSIIKLDVNKLLELLNKAYADEWLAYYQYWVGAKVAKGIMREPVANELMEHANEELEHAEKLAERILQLGGTPIIKPEDWYKMCNCGYEAPENPNTEVLLKQNIKGEQCAIGVYNKLLEFIGANDPITFHLIREILEDEVEHEDDLENLLEDFESMKK